MARHSFSLHTKKRKVSATDLDNDNFGGYSVNQHQRLNKGSRVDWPRSTFVELNEICRRLDLSLDYDEVTDLYATLISASEDNIINFRLNDSRQLYSAIKKLEITKDLSR